MATQQQTGQIHVTQMQAGQKLAGSYDVDAAGLPRGRSSLPVPVTRDAQYRRLVQAGISAFAELGYHATTITDIVTRARVSRQAFYKIFEGKEDCFLAAEEVGRSALFTGMAAVTSSQSASVDGWIRAPIRIYLQICHDEPQFVRAWTIEFPNVSTRTLARRNAFFVELAALMQRGHQLAKSQSAESWLAVPDSSYEAVVGGAHEMIFRCISQERYGDLLALEDPIVSFAMMALGYRHSV